MKNIMNLTKNKFNIIFELATKQPWLSNSADAVRQLLFEECSSEDERDLLIDLLNRFNYLDEGKVQQSLDDIVANMLEANGCTEENTSIVALTADNNADSGQYVLYRIKPILNRLGWKKPKLINNVNKIIREFPKRNKVFFIDEFIGSGQTVVGRVNRLKQMLEGAGHNDYFIKVFSIASSIVGEKYLDSKKIPFFTTLTVPRGISDYYTNDVQEKLSLMENVEKVLSNSYEGIVMPSLGYGEAEALYVRETGNSPNNVFPIFWWEFNKEGEQRLTLLTRSMGDA